MTTHKRLNPSLMRGVHIRVKEADGDRVELLAEALNCVGGRALVEWQDDGSIRTHALHDLVDTSPRDQRLRWPVPHVIHLWTVRPPDLVDVTETSRRQQSDTGSASLEECVQASSGSVREFLDLVPTDAEALNCGENAVVQVARRRQCF